MSVIVIARSSNAAVVRFAPDPAAIGIVVPSGDTRARAGGGDGPVRHLVHAPCVIIAITNRANAGTVGLFDLAGGIIGVRSPSVVREMGCADAAHGIKIVSGHRRRLDTIGRGLLHAGDQPAPVTGY